MIEILAQVEGKDGRGRPFTAGIVLWDDKVVVAAPILRRHFAGKWRDQVRLICKRRGWHISIVHEVHRPDEVPGREYR